MFLRSSDADFLSSPKAPNIVGPLEMHNHGPSRFDPADLSAYVGGQLPGGWELWGSVESVRADTGHANPKFWTIRSEFAERMETGR